MCIVLNNMLELSNFLCVHDALNKKNLLGLGDNQSEDLQSEDLDISQE